MPTQALNDQIEMAAIDSIRPHPRNARQGDIGLVAQSIAENGWYGACHVQRKRRGGGHTDTMVAGEHRWRALTALQRDGYTRPDGTHVTYEELAQRVALPEIGFVPIIPRAWSDEQALRILIADNRTSDVAVFDDNALAQLLTELAAESAGLLGTGFDGDDLDRLIADLGDTPPRRGDADTDEHVIRYGVVVECRDESDQRALLEELLARGLNVNALTT